jgi:hypothetical protein
VQQLFSSSSLITHIEKLKKADASHFLKERPPLGGECISITLEDGSRKYLLKRCANNITSTSSSSVGHQNLLSKSIKEVAAEAEARKIAKLAAAQQAVEVQPTSAKPLSSFVSGELNTSLPSIAMKSLIFYFAIIPICFSFAIAIMTRYASTPLLTVANISSQHNINRLLKLKGQHQINPCGSINTLPRASLNY